MIGHNNLFNICISLFFEKTTCCNEKKSLFYLQQHNITFVFKALFSCLQDTFLCIQNIMKMYGR